MKKNLDSSLKASLTSERLKELVVYNPDSGLFYNKAGRVMGTLNKKHKYIYIGVDNKLYRAHRLAWLYTHGCWPTKDIDHINGVRDDNRLTNLRDVSRSFNLLGKVGKENKSSGIKGIYKQPNGRYRAYYSLNNRRVNVGIFDNLEDAVLARDAAVYEFKQD